SISRSTPTAHRRSSAAFARSIQISPGLFQAILQIGEILIEHVPDLACDRPVDRHEESGWQSSAVKRELDRDVRAVAIGLERKYCFDLDPALVMRNRVPAVPLEGGDLHVRGVDTAE